MKSQSDSILMRIVHRIGFRKVKSILAMFVGFWVWQLIRIPFPGLEVHPIYIYIYGVIEIRGTSAQTVKLGKSRIKSTFTAIAVGLPILALQDFLFGFLGSEYAKIALELGLLLWGTLVTLVVAEKVGCDTFCGLAAAIFIILVVSHQDNEVYWYSILRSIQTILGVGVAYLINVKWFPYYGPKKE